MAAITVLAAPFPRELSFDLLSTAMGAARLNAGGQIPTHIVAHPDQRKRYALLFGREACPFMFGGIPIVDVDTMPRDAMEFRLDDRPLVLIRNLVV